jgi:predicted nucleic acid-binding protein
MPAARARVVVDSGPVIALFDAGDTYHLQAVDFVRRSRATLLSSMAVVTEAMYVLERSLKARRNLLSWIGRGGLTLVEPESADFARIAELIEKYADFPMDFSDAVLVVLCERMGIQHVASVDRDFAIYRYGGRAKFINVFFA